MGLFGFSAGANINEGVKEFADTEGAVLLDVRTPEEYAAGHIEYSLNIPLDDIAGAAARIPDKQTPVYTYCLSGARSGRAAAYLKRLGYSKVKNIGGIFSYRGKVVR